MAGVTLVRGGMVRKVSAVKRSSALADKARGLRALMSSYARTHDGIFIIAPHEHDTKFDADVYCVFRNSSFADAKACALKAASAMKLHVEIYDGTKEPSDLLSFLARFGLVVGDRRKQPRGQREAGSVADGSRH